MARPKRPQASRAPNRPRPCLKCDKPTTGYLCESCRESNARVDETFVDRGAVRAGDSRAEE